MTELMPDVASGNAKLCAGLHGPILHGPRGGDSIPHGCDGVTGSAGLGTAGTGAPGLAVATAADGQLARPHPGVLKTAAVVVPQTRRVAGRPSISGENHHVAPAVTAPDSEILLAQEQTTTCYADRK